MKDIVKTDKEKEEPIGVQEIHIVITFKAEKDLTIVTS